MKYILIVLLSLSTCILTAQSIELSSLFTTSEINDYKNAFGYDLGFGEKRDNKNRFSFHFSHCIKNAHYDEIRIDKESNGPQFPSYYFSKINSKNQRFGVRLNVCHYVIEADNSALGFGSRFSYYWYFSDKQTETTYYHTLPIVSIHTSESQSHESAKNRIGLNLFTAFELKSIVDKNLNLFSKINIGLNTYGTFAKEDGGFDYPWLTKWLTLNLGVRYDFKSK